MITFPNYMEALKASKKAGLYYKSSHTNGQLKSGVKTSLSSVYKAGTATGTPATVMVAKIKGRKRPVMFCSVEEKDFSSKFGMMSADDLHTIMEWYNSF